MSIHIANDHFSAALSAAGSGDLRAAATAFSKAADAFLAAGAPDKARAALSNLGHVHKQTGNLPGALEALDRAVATLDAAASAQVGSGAEAQTATAAPHGEKGIVLLNRAGVLDRMLDARARSAWLDAASCFASAPLMRAVCLAHAAGAAIAAEAPDALDACADCLRALGDQATNALLAGLLGAIGDSAGPFGVPFLAQAAWLMTQRLDAFNPSNAPHLTMLAERIGLAEPGNTAICALLMILTGTWKGKPEHDALFGASIQLVQRCAAAREMGPDALLTEIQSTRLERIVALLRSLVPNHYWLIAN